MGPREGVNGGGVGRGGHGGSKTARTRGDNPGTGAAGYILAK
jgi:hypothetical protein